MTYCIILAQSHSPDTSHQIMTWSDVVENDLKTNKTKLAKSVGALVATRRKAIGLTQAELAEKLGIEQESMSRIETGNITPSLTRLVSLADALNCSVESLLRPCSYRKQDQVLVLEELLNGLDDTERAFAVQVVTDFAKLMRLQKKQFGR